MHGEVIGLDISRLRSCPSVGMKKLENGFKDLHKIRYGNCSIVHKPNSYFLIFLQYIIDKSELTAFLLFCSLCFSGRLYVIGGVFNLFELYKSKICNANPSACWNLEKSTPMPVELSCWLKFEFTASISFDTANDKNISCFCTIKNTQVIRLVHKGPNDVNGSIRRFYWVKEK